MNTENYLRDVIDRFAELKKLAEKAIQQVPPEQLSIAIDPEANSILVLMKHMAGNMKSRWTDFLTSDGEKPDRRRDQEFEQSDDFDSVHSRWREGWKSLFDALSALKPENLDQTVLIRNEPHTVYQAINRQLPHYGYHVGQIVFLAKHLVSENWRSLSIPRGDSPKFNRSKGL